MYTEAFSGIDEPSGGRSAPRASRDRFREDWTVNLYPPVKEIIGTRYWLVSAFIPICATQYTNI